MYLVPDGQAKSKIGDLNPERFSETYLVRIQCADLSAVSILYSGLRLVSKGRSALRCIAHRNFRGDSGVQRSANGQSRLNSMYLTAEMARSEVEEFNAHCVPSCEIDCRSNAISGDGKYKRGANRGQRPYI